MGERSSIGLARTAIAGTLTATLALLTGCASGTPETPAVPTPAPEDQPLQPTEPPLDYRRVSGAGFRLGVPSSYEEVITAFPNGVTVSQWRAPHPGEALSTAITVVREAAPTQSAEQQAAALVRRLRDEDVDAARVGLTWPGARSAQFVVWQEAPRGGGEARRIEQLMVQANDGVIFSVVAFAPDALFETTDLPRSSSTFSVMS
ncbi:MAG: hypothetical protein QM708_04525 [Propioniciclava sp.]|uniref:hypothetical protein n=1 Tax=Propioniciclava sp. TaxID=2038686 RepID=UPI0039E51370